MKYEVYWCMAIEAPTPREAAQLAQYYQRATPARTTLFVVCRPGSMGDIPPDAVEVDLLETDEAERLP